jgi:hypothetical protein
VHAPSSSPFFRASRSPVVGDVPVVACPPPRRPRRRVRTPRAGVLARSYAHSHATRDTSCTRDDEPLLTHPLTLYSSTSQRRAGDGQGRRPRPRLRHRVSSPGPRSVLSRVATIHTHPLIPSPYRSRTSVALRLLLTRVLQV